MELESVLDVAQIDELVHLAVAVARQVGEHGTALLEEPQSAAVKQALRAFLTAPSPP
jgi:hypothetical protein